MDQRVRLATRQIAIYPSLLFHFSSTPTVFLSIISEGAKRFYFNSHAAYQ
jgi:hypothetical protein